MFQGMARGKVGDVVFTRMNGEQISRVRNRHPKNPRTNKQLIQRAIMATVLRAYSTGKEIFDHSFQYDSFGEGNQRKFLSLNMKRIRQNLAQDFETTPTQHVATVVNAPGTITPVPNRYIVSEGEYQQNFFTIEEANATAIGEPTAIKTPAGLTSETIGAYMERNNLLVGDIYTFVGYAVDGGDKSVFTVENGIGYGTVQMDGHFFFVRLIVKEPADASKPVADVDFQDLFEIDETGNVRQVDFLDGTMAGANIKANALFTMADDNKQVWSFAIIRSRENSRLRSTSEMVFVNYNNVTGINWQNLLPAWTQGATSIGDSDLILEGGNF